MFADRYRRRVAQALVRRTLPLGLLLASLPGCSEDPSAAPPVVLNSCGHAHNDYEHERPLVDALERDFCSLEADVFLVGDALLVAHTAAETDPSRTLESLYLDPLRSWVAQHGQAHSGGTLLLLIDVKSDAAPTYARLHTVLASYADILTQFSPESSEERAVTAVISGNRDRQGMEAQALRYAAMDGRLADLEGDAPVTLIPLISDNWIFNIGWNGVGEVPSEVRDELEVTAKRTHEQGRRLRFWASPDHAAAWTLQIETQVDLINTDDLPGLQQHLVQAATP